MTFGKDFFEEKLGWTKVYDGGYNSAYWYASPEKPEEINKDFNPDEFSAVPYVPEHDEDYLANVPEGTKSIVFDMDWEQKELSMECGLRFKDLTEAGKKIRTFSCFSEAVSDDMEPYVEEEPYED